MPIDPQQAKSLFLAALDRPAAERAAFLDAACAGDETLRQRVAAMLAAHAESGELLPSAALEAAASSFGEATSAFDPHKGSDTHPETLGDVELACLEPSTNPRHLGRLAHYEVMELIGKGGFGSVFKAFDTKLQRVVAIKVLAPELAASGTARSRFIREAQAAAAVKNEHVVAIHNVEDEHRPPYLVMELIDGITLQERLDEEGPLDVKEILRIGLQTAEGLAAAHKQGLVHRDIKPGNILLENGVQRVKITDFGLAKVADDASITQSGVIAGTPMYMSPEQAEGLVIDHRSDLFSLGSVLYVMCTGRPPFRASGTMAVLKRVCEETPRPIREVNPELPDWLGDIIARLHAKSPEDRFATAREVADLLGERLADVQAGRFIPGRAAKRFSAGKRAALLGLVGAAALLAAFFLLGRGDREDPKNVQPPVAKKKQPEEVQPQPVVAVADKDGWVPLFNGKDQTGWSRESDGPGNWTVVDGALTCSGDTDYLYTGRGDYGDFHLRAKVKINAAGNSGIFFRSAKNLAESPNGAYEAQIALKNKGPDYQTGSLHLLAQVSESPVPADTWFDYEIIARGKHLRLLVNGKETASYVEERPGRRSSGHIALQHWKAFTQVHFKDIEIKELPPTDAAPFVVLSKAGRAETRHASLGEAVAAAESGDTIEIQGDGPFDTTEIRIQGKPLVIRAGAGFRPVIRTSPDGGGGAPKMQRILSTDAALVLEGLDLQHLPDTSERNFLGSCIVAFGPLRVTHCRLFQRNPGRAISGASRVLQSSMIVLGGAGSVGIGFGEEPGTYESTVRNCIVVSPTEGLLHNSFDLRAKDGVLKLENNTWCGRSVMEFAYLAESLLEKVPDDSKPIHVRSSAEVYFSKAPFPLGYVRSVRMPAALTREQVRSSLQRLLTWKETANAYSSFNAGIAGTGENLPRDVVGDLEDWHAFWKVEKPAAVQGPIAFQGGDLVEKAATDPLALRPADFRLAPGSPGKGAGPGGKDLGADVDLVGPGAAYERWRKTPAYQEWQKKTEAMMAKVAVEGGLPRPDGKAADMSRAVQVYLLLGQESMVGSGKVDGGEGSLTHAVKQKKLYPYLVDDAGQWTVRQDVRFVQVRDRLAAGNLVLDQFEVRNNDWLKVGAEPIGPEFGIGHHLGQATDAPVLLLKSCNGNRALGWDLLPPGSPSFEFATEGKVWHYAGYKETPHRWEKGTAPEKVGWYAGRQYDADTTHAKLVLKNLAAYYPGYDPKQGYEIAGFFFWQGERDLRDAGHVSRYEENLVRLIRQLRKDFEAPSAGFVCATLGRTAKGATGHAGKILAAHLAVDGSSGKYPEFKGNVATVYSHPLLRESPTDSPYAHTNAETYMNVGEAMGRAMVELSKSKTR